MSLKFNPLNASGFNISSGGGVQADGSTPFTAPQGGVTPVASSDLATKGYVDSHTGATTALDNLASTAVNADINPASDNTINLGVAAVVEYKSVNTKRVESGGAITIASGGILSLSAANGINAANSVISGVVDPSNPQDAATKAYVDSHSSNILVFTSNPGPSGVAGTPIFDVAFVVPGLLATDTILSVTQKTPGASGTLALLGWHSQADNALTGEYVADPGVGSIVLIAVKR